MGKQRCEGCRWFHRSGSQLIGECRRYPPQHAHTQHGWLMVEQGESCGEWTDGSITPEQAERRELVRQFAVAIIQGWHASASGVLPNRCLWSDYEVGLVWEQAQAIADAEGRQ